MHGAKFPSDDFTFIIHFSYEVVTTLVCKPPKFMGTSQKLC
jgi:hypothetical protein